MSFGAIEIKPSTVIPKEANNSMLFVYKKIRIGKATIHSQVNK